MSTKIGALWKREYVDKETNEKRVFYSGDLEWPGVKGRVVLHKNDKGGNEKAPDLILVYESIDPRKEGQAGAKAGGDQEPPDGDIPF